MVSCRTNETILFTEIIPSHIKIHHLSMFIHRENEILFPPHQIMQYFLWFKFNQAVLCHSSINPKQRRSDVRMKYTSSQVNCFDYANCVWLRQSNCFWGCYCTECTASRVCMNEQRSLYQQRFHEEEKGGLTLLWQFS